MNIEKSSRRKSAPEFLICYLGGLMLVAFSLFAFVVIVVIFVCLCRYFRLRAVFEIISWILAGLISLLIMSRLVRLECRRRFIEIAASAIVRHFSRHEKQDG